MRQPSWIRALFHFLGAAIPLIYFLTDKATALIVTATLLTLLLAADILRIRGCFRSLFIEKALKEREGNRPVASLLYVAACLAVILLFDRPVACASILVLAVSDPLSSIIGRRWGKRRFLRGKSPEGTAAFFVSALLILMSFPFEAPAILGAACGATMTEVFSSRFVDDNLTIPLATSLLLALLNG